MRCLDWMLIEIKFCIHEPDVTNYTISYHFWKSFFSSSSISVFNISVESHKKQHENNYRYTFWFTHHLSSQFYQLSQLKIRSVSTDIRCAVQPSPAHPSNDNRLNCGTWFAMCEQVTILIAHEKYQANQSFHQEMKRILLLLYFSKNIFWHPSLIIFTMCNKPVLGIIRPRVDISFHSENFSSMILFIKKKKTERKKVRIHAHFNSCLVTMVI